MQIDTVVLKKDDSRWQSAYEDATILEQKIAELIEAFEQKHKPIQCNVVTRWRKIEDLYRVAKGGAAQVYLNENPTGDISIIHSSRYRNGTEIIYSDVE